MVTIMATTKYKSHLVNVIGKRHSVNNVVEYKLGDVVLKSVNNVSDLGVNVDCKLNFCEHIVLPQNH